MDLRQLMYFVAIAEERQFTRAAARLHVVQSTLSASINALERELGIGLLIRNSRRVELTAAGHALLPAARRALAAAEDARTTVDEVRGLLRGHLAIGVAQALGRVNLSALLACYHQQHPGVDLSLHRNTIDGLVRETVAGDLDLAFVNRPFDPRRVDELSLGTESLVLVVSRDDPLAKEQVVALTDLEHRDFVGMHKKYAIRTRIDASCAAVGLNCNICCEADALSDLVDLVGSGLGIGFLPSSVAKDADRVVAVETEPAIPWELCVVTPARRPPSPAAAAFLDMLRECL
ncbi:MAG: LysR family transcriptional regulator [Mycobacterium sp.]